MPGLLRGGQGRLGSTIHVGTYPGWALSLRVFEAAGRGSAGRARRPLPLEVEVGAGDESRTRDPLLGKQSVAIWLKRSKPNLTVTHPRWEAYGRQLCIRD